MATKGRKLDRLLSKSEHLNPENISFLLKRLAKERIFFENIFNSIKEPIAVFNELGFLEYANEALLKMLGITQQKEKLSLFAYIDCLEEIIFAQKNSKDDFFSSIETQINYPKKRFIKINIFPFISDDNEDIKFSAVITDITDEKMDLQEKLENERITSVYKLASGVAHEIGNPLNSLNIHLQVIKKTLQSSSDIDSIKKSINSLEVCLGETKRLDCIIKNFLNAIKPSQADFQDLNILEVIAEVISFQKEELENAKIKVKMNLSLGEPPVILGDKNHLKQVFFNLVKNSSQAMSGVGGEIEINASYDETNVYIEIKDNGSGIKSENISKVFDEYFTTKKEGTGLGMMIVRRIIGEHFGTLSIKSKENVGTLVKISFPLKNRKIKMLQKENS